MTEWRHVERGWDKGCGAPSDEPCGCGHVAERHLDDTCQTCDALDGPMTGSCVGYTGLVNCGCPTPTPDPASPCGQRFPFPFPAGDWQCGLPATHHPSPMREAHPHQPTRCTCGHAIEAINPGPAASGSEGGSDHG